MFDSSCMVVPGPDPAHQVLRDQLAARLRDPVLAGERLLPVSEAFAALLPGQGLRRGSVVAVTGSHALALALVAEASRTGSWVTAVGLDDLGILAAHEFGLVLERLALVPFPGRRWDDVVATMLDGAEVVMVRRPADASSTALRRLAARTRERGAVLVPLSKWPEADLRLELVRSVWLGLEQGHGRLEARQALVDLTGRGAAAGVRRAWLWLPDDQGQIRPVKTGENPQV
jgi:hypothetical protein